MNVKIDVRNMLKRFDRYVKIDTQSAEESETYPSTLKQLDLCKKLVKELEEIGAKEVKMTEHGYVFATIPATMDNKVLKNKNVPVIGFIAHVDTSPDVSGENVKPIIHKKYTGGDIILPADATQVILESENQALTDCIGHDIITTDGTTLLGADNKAGIAEIMAAADFLIKHPEIAHGKIRIAFTVDEEVGTGTKYFDVKEFGADYAYTIDGETAGELEDETFCADTVTIVFKGVNIHPGYAKDKLVNSIKLAAEFVEFLPRNHMSPESTEKRQGYVHPTMIKGGTEETTVKLIIRDFTVEGLKEKEDFLKEIVGLLEIKYPAMEYDFSVEESYRNMKYILEQHASVVDYAMEAISRTGLTPKKNLIRGGTDGANLSFKGLPTPNIFTGGHNFHSKKEWISVQDMEKAAQTIVHIATVWAEKGKV